MRFLKRGSVVWASRWFVPGDHPRVEPHAGGSAIATPEGWREARPGDWILTDEAGTVWPMSDTQFRSLYAPA